MIDVLSPSAIYTLSAVFIVGPETDKGIVVSCFSFFVTTTKKEIRKNNKTSNITLKYNLVMLVIFCWYKIKGLLVSVCSQLSTAESTSNCSLTVHSYKGRPMKFHGIVPINLPEPLSFRKDHDA